jgi:hypothetical protein
LARHLEAGARADRRAAANAIAGAAAAEQLVPWREVAAGRARMCAAYIVGNVGNLNLGRGISAILACRTPATCARRATA